MSDKINLSKMTRLLIVIVVLFFSFIVQSVAAQNVPGNPRYYDHLMDSLFRDVQNVVQLGMDYAIRNEKRIESDFTEWVTGRDLKTPEQEDYFKAVHTLHDGWELLLQGGRIYHEMRQRQTNDATTKRMREQANQLRLQGTAKVKEAISLRQAADKKRNARIQAEKEKEERQKAELKEQNINDVKTLSEEFEKLNQEEDQENNKYNTQLGMASAEPNLKKRQILLNAENARHEKRQNEIDRKRDELGKKMNDLIARQSREGRPDVSQEWMPPDSSTTEMNGDVCFLRPTKKFEGCGGSMQNEYNRWQQEVAANAREFKAENERHNRRLKQLTESRAKPEQIRQENECHEKRSEQIEEEGTRLQERHLKCFGNDQRKP
mgnify:CR=1 FL=1